MFLSVPCRFPQPETRYCITLTKILYIYWPLHLRQSLTVWLLVLYVIKYPIIVTNKWGLKVQSEGGNPILSYTINLSSSDLYSIGSSQILHRDYPFVTLSNQLENIQMQEDHAGLWEQRLSELVYTWLPWVTLHSLCWTIIKAYNS